MLIFLITILGQRIHFLSLAAVAEAGFGFSITAAVRPSRWRARLSARHLPRGGAQLQQALQTLDVVNGRAQRLHFTEPFVLELPRQVLPEARVTLVHAAHPVALALVPLLDERGLEGVIADAERGAEGQVGEASAGQPLAVDGVEVGRVQVEEGERVRVVRGAAVAVKSQRSHEGNMLHELLTMKGHLSKK